MTEPQSYIVFDGPEAIRAFEALVNTDPAEPETTVNYHDARLFAWYTSATEVADGTCHPLTYVSSADLPEDGVAFRVWLEEI